MFYLLFLLVRAYRNAALECLEDFVISFLVKIVDAVPSAYDQQTHQSNKANKITLQLADRTKKFVEGHVHAVKSRSID